MDTPLLEQLKSVPLLPGVYIWKDAGGQVLYVGKAKQLRNRMRQYLLKTDERAMIPLLVEQIDSFEYLVTENEHESLVLEKNLIQQYHPPFNVDFRDDKSYPYIALTKGDVFPALKYTREKHVPSTRYFGPYTDARAARTMVDVARRVVPLCSANCAEWKRLKRKLDAGEKASVDKVCFDAHVGLGPGACSGACSPEEYAENVARVERFLAGSRKEFLDEVRAEMQEAAEDLDFERAARCRKRLEAIEGLSDRQHVSISRSLDADIIGFYREETITGVHVAVVREGNIIIDNEFVLDKGLDVSDDDLIDTFLVRYYDEASDLPREVVLEKLPEDAALLESWLTTRLDSPFGAKVRLVAPQRGEKHDLLLFAQRNAKHTLMRFKTRTRYDDERINEALLQLESALALPDAPLRIECYDVSTIHGAFSVASMVVFDRGKPDKSQYRRFRIRMESDEANDFAMMSETLGRRFSPERVEDERFGSLPDLLIVDGGKPQLTAALNQLHDLGLDEIPVAGLAKRDEELFVPWDDSGPVVLPSGSAALYLVKQVRDEAHRFAITFHRELRDKAMTASILDEVEGLGPKRKKALLKAFRNIKGIRAASVDDIAAVPGIPRQVAENLKELLEGLQEEQEDLGKEGSGKPGRSEETQDGTREGPEDAQLILASASPRRRDLLDGAGYTFIIHPSQTEEMLDRSLPLEEAIADIARQKAQAVAAELGHLDRPLIACDTLVVLGDRILGKPQDEEDACQMLRALSGNTHRVISGVCLLEEDQEPLLFWESSSVTFRDLGEEEIRSYVASGEPLDKAGAYAIQGGAAAFVDHYEGDWDNIVGLPLTRLAQELAKRGIIPSREVG